MKIDDEKAEVALENTGGLHDYLAGIGRTNAAIGNTDRLYPADQDWHDIFDTITDMITIHDSNFTIIHANKAAERILGLPVLNSESVKCFEYYHGSDCPPAGCPSCRCVEAAKPSTFEMFEPHLNMYIEIRVIPRFDSENKFIGLIHIVRDITSRKLTEEELHIHRDHLEWLVRQRTAEISKVNEQLEKEIAERRRACADKERLIKELREALTKIKKLSGLLPMCAWCKKIRDDQGYWQRVEAYICEHSDAKFTHGICPDCAGKLVEELG